MNHATRSACQIQIFAGLCLFSFLSAADAGTIFDVSFDGTFNSTLTPPFVGSGTVSFDQVLGDGTYLLTGLNNLKMSFTIGADTWTYADIVAPNPSLSITIYDAGKNFYFNGPPSSSPFLGAADFINASGDGLTTQPNTVGSPPFNRYIVVSTTGVILRGTYGVATVPEPASILFVGMGALGLLWQGSRRRKIAGVAPTTE